MKSIKKFLVGKFPLFSDQLILARAINENFKKTKHVISQTRPNLRFNLPLLMPFLRCDGVGFQATQRICILLLSRQTNTTYIHIPFERLAHLNIDNSTREEWERFLNLGQGETQLSNIKSPLMRLGILRAFYIFQRQYTKPNIRWKGIYDKIQNIRDDSTTSERYQIFDDEIMSNCLQNKLQMDNDFIKSIQDKFNHNGFEPTESFYNDKHLNIAIHIRRGDVSHAIKSKTSEVQYTQRYVGNTYYIDLISRLDTLFQSSHKKPHFHIFSDGYREEFPEFTFRSGSEAILKRNDDEWINNIYFHLRSNSFDTLYHMTKADIFIPGKSSFSFLATVLTKSFILYEKDIFKFHVFDLLNEYIKNSKRFIDLRTIDQNICQQIMMDREGVKWRGR